MKNNISVRFSNRVDENKVNTLRKMVNDLHVNGSPERFKDGFHDVSAQLDGMYESDEFDVIVAEVNGMICGYACIRYVNKPETPFTKSAHYIHVDEFGVDERYRRIGVATALIGYIKEHAKKRCFCKVELNVWNFNDDALKFYEAVGFKTYRRYMELRI